MMLWSIIVVLALLVSLGLVIVARLKASSNEQSGQVSSEEHFKVQLAAIAADVKSTRLEPAEAEAAKSEIARELMRHRATDIVEQAGPDEKLLKIGLPLASLVIFVFAIGSYMLLGSPEVPSAPYAARMAAVQQDRLSIEDAISRVEQQLERWLLTTFAAGAFWAPLICTPGAIRRRSAPLERSWSFPAPAPTCKPIWPRPC